MLVQEYLSMQQTIDLVFELTGEKIDGSTLEELSNIEKLTPVFLFSGYVSYPDINYKTIRYDKMKAYFTHDDFFMHQTRNYEGYSMFGDADVPEWIEIHSPFTIQKIIKQQSKAYSVFDEVFLFKNPPIGEVDKLDDLKYSNIDFDEVRFSRNELIALFNVKKPYASAQNEFEFYLNAAKTIRDSVTADINARNDLIEPVGSQRLLISYVLFTPHEITCLLSNGNPAYTHNDNDKYNAYKDMVSKAIEAKALNPINDKEQIPAEQIKSWLARYNFIIRGFNDNLSNDTDKISAPTVTQTEPPNNEQLIKRLTAANAKITDLENQLAQAKADLADKPADSITQSNTDIHNIKKEAIKQFNRSLATVLVKLDYQERLRKHDIANYIMPYMKKLAFVLADEQQDKADNLTVTYDTLYDTHLQGLGFKQGRQSDSEKQKVNIDLLFEKQLPVTE